MTNEPSPRPWRVADYAQCPGLADVFDASGSPSGLVAGELKPADAALIVDAVNSYAIKSPCRVCAGYTQKGGCIADERDRLRDLVRRLAEYADAVTCYRPPAIEVVSSEHPAWTFDGAALIREARAAIGEVETPKGKGVGD